MRSTLVATVLIVVLCALPALAQQSTREDFKEFTKAVSGRWIGEITWVTDWPGLGKRGDKATGYSEIKMTEDGNAIIGRQLAGSGSAT